MSLLAAGVGMGPVIFVAAGLLVILFVFLMIWASRYVKIPPNQALIVTGRPRRMGRRTVGFRIVSGGATFVIPVIERAQLLSLEPFTVTFRTKVPRVPQGTTHFDAQAHVKIKGEDESIASAAEHFLSKSPDEIGAMAGAILERHLHVAASGAAFEREALESAVRKTATEDLAPMGLEILNLSIKETPDAHGKG